MSCKELWPKENSANDVLSLGLEDVLPLKVGSALEEGVNVTGRLCDEILQFIPTTEVA